ncbi:MAG: helix-turn-helix domain-containing protein [Chitinophagales bacterium]
MTEYQFLLDQIPIQYDLFSLCVFASILLGILIFISILQNNKPENQALYFLGVGILLLSFIKLDFFLSYTGLMKYVLWLNNTSEVLVLLMVLCFYFFIQSLLEQKRIQLQKKWFHFIVPVLYFATQWGIYLQSNVLKLNNYITGFHPHLSPIIVEPSTSLWLDLAIITNAGFHELLIVFFLVYIFLTLKVIRKYNASLQKHFSKPKSKSLNKLEKYHFSIYAIGILIVTTIVTIIVFVQYSSDLGERYIMVFPMFVVFLLAYIMMSKSHFFDNSWLLEKYHTSGLNLPAGDVLQKITTFVEKEAYYLKKSASLKDLAAKLSLSPTYLSQVVNHQSRKNFNDFINQYRIEEAKKRLVDDAYKHLNIAGIGETVGFKSKSAFYAAFKKHTQFTPAAYTKAMKILQNPSK